MVAGFRYDRRASRVVHGLLLGLVPMILDASLSANASGQSDPPSQSSPKSDAPPKTEPEKDQAGSDQAQDQTPKDQPGSAPPSELVEPPSDRRTRARHSEPAIFTPPPESPPRDVWFPSVQRPLHPYLQLADRFGTNSFQAGSLIENDPVSSGAQWLKSELAKVGLRYSFDQTLVGTSMSNRVSGDSVIGAYGYNFFGNWTLFEADELGGTSGWVSAKVVGDFGLGTDLDEQSPDRNIGAISSPNGNYRHNHVGVEELAWAQSFVDGEFVVMAGLINQTNYLDINKYANSLHGQFLNSSLVNSLVIPAPSNNLGLTLQWQPVDSFYAMLGLGPNNQNLGQNPTHDVSQDNFSYVGELGLVLSDVAGLGPGTFRLQPFAATWEGKDGHGIAVNLEQQLGPTSPLGAFARVGFGDRATASIPGSVETQVSAGLAMLAPFGERGLFSGHNNDFAGLGFVWSKAANDPTIDHQDEYAVELTMAIQLTPTSTIQPDLQCVWNPINNPDSGPSIVAQLQLNIAW
jgi:porin